MNGRNRSLQCVRAEAVGYQGSLHQCHSLRDLLRLPSERSWFSSKISSPAGVVLAA